jgi:hypothetical protein
MVPGMRQERRVTGSTSYANSRRLAPRNHPADSTDQFTPLRAPVCFVTLVTFNEYLMFKHNNSEVWTNCGDEECSIDAFCVFPYSC